MAEAMLRQLGGDRFVALSAGSHPAGYIHPLAIHALETFAVPMGDQRSKGWDEFAGEPMDAVITLCDDAAKLPCPNWSVGSGEAGSTKPEGSGEPIRAHWSTPDPSGHLGTEDERVDMALRIAKQLRNRIERLVRLDWSAPRGELERQVQSLADL